MKLSVKAREKIEEVTEGDVFLNVEGRQYRGVIVYHKRVQEATRDMDSQDWQKRQTALKYLENLCPRVRRE